MTSNLVTQIASLALWIFALAGLQIVPEQVAGQAVTAIQTANWPLFLILLFNVGNSVWQWSLTWKTNKPGFINFLRSPNWWVSFCNILFAGLALKGIAIPAEASAQIVDYIFSGRYWELIGFLVPNVLGPIVKFLTTKKIDP